MNLLLLVFGLFLTILGLWTMTGEKSYLLTRIIIGSLTSLSGFAIVVIAI